MEFRDAVKHLRNELGLTQVELAAGLHMNAITIGRWENGRTLPTRSITAVLLDYARSKGASKKCLDLLEQSINSVARGRLDFSDQGLYAIEHASLRQLIDGASFPIYVCDIETDELLYLNQKACAMVRGKESAIGKKCYQSLMRRDTPCQSCHKDALVEEDFTIHNIYRPYDGATFHVQGKLIQWNGRKAQVNYLLEQVVSPEQWLNGADTQGASPAPDTKQPGKKVPGELISQSSKDEKTAAWLTEIFNHINGGVSVAIHEDNGTVRLGFANDHYYKLFGYTKEQFFNELKDPHDTVHPEDWEKASAAIGKVKKTKQAVTFRYRIIKRDKSVAYVRCSSSLTTIDGVSGEALISILTDITESIQSEQQAIVFGQRLDAIMKNMNSAVTASLVKDNGTVEFLFFNDLFHEMLGYTREQYQANIHSPFTLVHPEDADTVRGTVLNLRHIGDETELLYRAITKDGCIKWLRTRISVMTFPDAAGPVQLCVYTDVTDIMEARERIATQHEQIAELLNETPSGIAIIEVDPKDIAGTLRTTFYNDRFISFSGYDREEYDALLQNNELAFVFDEDIPILMEDAKKMCAGELGVSCDSTVRCHTKDGGFRWLLLTGQLAERHGDTCVINIALMDVTERQEALDRQRINEEMLRIAAETDQRALIIYNVKDNSCRVESRNLFSAEYGEIIENIPQALIDRGVVAPDSEGELRALFARIQDGETAFRVALELCSGTDKYEWFQCNAATVFDNQGFADHAVLVFHNITEQRIKEAVFKKWQQSIDTRPNESYTLFRCNLCRDSDIDERNGSLLKISFPPETMSFNDRTKLYAEEYVYTEDRETYIKLLDADSLLAMFYRGEHSASLDYRETTENGEVLWRRLTVETVEYPNSSDVQAFLMYEDIDEDKKTELATEELAATDPLTGALNRSAFAEKVDELINMNPGVHCALIMLDMDGFKQLNDTFGHAAGDQALQDVVAVLRSFIRRSDLICRLGGDEFFVWLQDIPYDAVIGKIAKQICAHIRKAYSEKVLLSASAGIAVYPRDGHSYDELYPNADKALYKVKQAGKGSYAFFSVIGEEQTEEITEALSAVEERPRTAQGAKRRILIVDDSEISRMMLKNCFKDEYLVETAKNGTEAMIRLRHFGVSISVVLLDLMMPDINGFTVLRRMQSDVDLRTIPVIVVTGDEEHATLLKALEFGAAEYVTKPVDADIIRMRVKSVVSKAESERLRAQNSYLMLQRDEEAKYRTVLESTGTVVIEYNWRNHVFIYNGEVSKHLAGNFDHRGLWQVFLSDMVADSADVKLMQDALITLANNRKENHSTKLVKLKTPSGVKHWFRMNLYKSVDDFGLAEKLFITFNDVHDEVLSKDKLLFQATRDSLTGLYNRTGFLEKAAELIATKEPGYYVMSCIDVEKFKVINDQYGTEKGDEVLKHIAVTVNDYLQSRDGICCRYMADEFAVLYPANLRYSEELLENHRAAIAPGCIPHPLRLRIGRCLVNDTTLAVSAIFDRAAMAESLAKGRYDTHIIDYDESMRDKLLQEQKIVIDMVDALKKGEFEPWYQPQYNHATGALIGAEALVRWCKNGKTISPDKFVPVFEKNGFIYEVDQSIWRQVCASLRRWLDEGKNPLPVSVNVSRHDMFQQDFVEVITGLVAEYRLPAELLRLEITESAFSATTDVITTIAGKLIAAGFTVEIDDFGSGYSSLNTLKDVPASILKLDMRFFETTDNTARGGNIVEAIVRMAKWLGMAIIAEGVEDKAQADYLKSIGCYYIQGYYYSQPLPLEEYEKRMQEGITEPNLSHLKTVESLDANLFWDPKSMETLIFNSYVGGACIFEYHNGNAEMLRYNDQYICELHGLIPQNAEIQEVNIVPYLDEKSKKEMVEALQDAYNYGREASSEMRLTKGEQTEYVFQTSRVIAKTTDRTLYYCVIQNITDLRRLEKERTENAERLSLIMGNINGGVTATVFHNEDHIEIVFANDGYYELFGYTKVQFEAEVPNIFDLILAEDRKNTINNIAKIMEERGNETYEARCRKRDGSVIWVQTAITVASLAGVSNTVLIAVSTDITALRHAEEQSRRTSDRLSAVMNAMTNGMTAVTAQEQIQFLFANNHYYKIHGLQQESNTREVLYNAFSMIHPDDCRHIRDIVKSTATVGQHAEAEYRVNHPDGTIHYVKMEITVTTLIGVDVPVQVAMYADITEEKKASIQLRLLNESAGEILAQPDSEKAINDTLQKLLDYFAGERTYIFELNEATRTSDNTYELCAPGITSEIQRLKGVPYDTQQNWFDAFNKTGFIAISDVAAIEESEAVIRELLLAQNIRSIIVAPLWRDGKLIGYIGVDNPTEAVDQVRQLMAISDYIAVLLTRRDLVKAVNHERHMVQQLMDDTPGGFLRMELFDDKNPTIVTMNNGLCKMLDMTKDEVMAAYGDDVFTCLAVDDADAAPEEMRQAYISSKQYTSTCRLRKKDGSLFWVMLFGRFVHGEGGKLYLNAYFTNITEERTIEQLQSEILDNLPFGAAMYRYNGESLTTLHLNKQYTALVNRKQTYMTKSYNPIDAIHPDDRKPVFDEIRAAIAEGRNGVCDIRLLYGKDEYRFFHLDATIVPKEDGNYVLYVAYAPITDKELELKITSERLKLLSESIPGGIATFRCMAGSIEPIYFNDGICTLTGYSREEFESNKISVLDLIFDEDKPIINKQIDFLTKGNTTLDYSVRIHTKTGGYKWVECVANATAQESEGVFLVSAVLTDVTVHQEERERLRVSEELNRLAINQIDKVISRYDVATRTLTLPYMLPPIFDIPRILENMPEGQVEAGRISPETADIYCGMFKSIHDGKISGEITYQQNSSLGWRWLKSRFTTVFNSDDKPISAVITFEDITEQREKEAIYTRWQNTISARSEDSYTIVRCNLKKHAVTDSWEGNLLRKRFTDTTQSFNSRTAEYAENFVYKDDKTMFCAFLNSDTMLEEYQRGHRRDSLDYREQNQDGSFRWLRLTVDLVEYQDSDDVEAYLFFENINAQKHAEIATLQRAETDPLTGVLNRAAFAQRVNDIIAQADGSSCHALFMLDIDEFKQVNDVFGHGAGDQTLSDIAETLTRFCRKEDLVGRLGGDEFFLFLSNIRNPKTAAKKARQICDMTRKALSVEVHISSSIGIALYPQDGDDFKVLYKTADKALYRTKNAGKDGYSFSDGEPILGSDPRRSGDLSVKAKEQPEKIRRVLIVDDNEISQRTLNEILKESYFIEKASDGAAALSKLRRYGTAISVVLLDLRMPGMSGFEVLEKIQHNENTRTIPVIVVSADEDRETALRVIRAGASDLITKPVDADLLRIRMESAIAKSENDRLRLQNSYLSIRNTEVNGYRAALERTGTMLLMLDCTTHAFSYSPFVSHNLAGQFDERPLWEILRADKVTDEETVRRMERLVNAIENDEEHGEGILKVQLKTDAGESRSFEFYVFKERDDYGLASKIIMTLNETTSISAR